MKKIQASYATDIFGMGNVLDRTNGASTPTRNFADNLERRECVQKEIARMDITQMEYAGITTKMDVDMMKQDAAFYT